MDGFFRILEFGKDFIRTNMHTTVTGKPCNLLNKSFACNLGCLSRLHVARTVTLNSLKDLIQLYTKTYYKDFLEKKDDCLQPILLLLLEYFE